MDAIRAAHEAQGNALEAVVQALASKHEEALAILRRDVEAATHSRPSQNGVNDGKRNLKALLHRWVNLMPLSPKLMPLFLPSMASGFCPATHQTILLPGWRPRLRAWRVQSETGGNVQ